MACCTNISVGTFTGAEGFYFASTKVMKDEFNDSTNIFDSLKDMLPANCSGDCVCGGLVLSSKRIPRHSFVRSDTGQFQLQ